VENGGNASLETAKALAAVLEMPVEALFAEAPCQAAAIVSPPLLRYRFFKPWRTFAAGCLTTLIATGSFIGMQGAIAEQVLLDFALKVDDASVSQSRMISEDGTAAVMETSDLKISITPVIQKDGSVFLDCQIHILRDGEYELMAEPRMTVRSATPALIRVGNDDGSILELKVIPTIE
jgi:hypothetical protein